MQNTATDFRRLAQEGANALRQNDNQTAQRCFEQVVNAGMADASVFTGLSLACFRQGDSKAALGAIEYALKAEPRNLHALIVKGDILAASGEARTAVEFYQVAVQTASEFAQLPAELAREVMRASEACKQFASSMEKVMRDELAAAGFDTDAMTPRFRESLDVLFGHKKIYSSEPRYFHLPRLAAIPFHDASTFEWIPELEAATAAIRSEALAVMNEPEAFTPYVAEDPNRPYKPQGGMVSNTDWTAFFLWKNGSLIEENAARCPETMKALAKIPLTQMPHRSPSIFFSKLRPGAHIPPHNGMVNTRLLCHLPLIVPGTATFRVGNEQRNWQEGKAWVFDDSIEHEAWNDSTGTRVILLFEVWRPELTLEERNMVVELFAAIDRHNGTPSWEAQ
jgi:aspartyl/asparaginyl beta-hydroxylase (cupin superfamily)